MSFTPIRSFLSRVNPFRAPAAPPPIRLRIAWVEGGRIASERILAPGEALSLGEGGLIHVPGMERTVIAAPSPQGGWTLAVPLSRDEQDPVQIRLSRGEQRIGAEGAVRLEPGHRLKVLTGQGTLLCQVVEVPVMRRRTLEEPGEDRLFEGLLAGSAICFGAFSLWVQLLPPMMDGPDMGEVIQVLDLARVTPTTVDPATEAQGKTEAQETPKILDRAPAATPEAQAEQIGAAAGSRGRAAAEGLVAKLDLGGLQKDGGPILEWSQIPLGEGGKAPGSIIKGGATGELPDTIINVPGGPGGIMGPGGPGGPGGKGGPGTGSGRVEFKPLVKEDAPDITPEAGDTGDMLAVIRSYRSGVENCTATALAADPRVGGRITVGWEVVAGRVQASRLLTNSTGSDTLGSCISNVVRRMRFAPEITGTVDGYTWVVSGR